MHLGMKKTCNSCRAYPTGWVSTCELGIAVKRTTVIDGLIYNYSPLEECHKPKTYSQLIECMDNKRNRSIR